MWKKLNHGGVGVDEKEEELGLVTTVTTWNEMIHGSMLNFLLCQRSVLAEEYRH
jgi:hypothetical protein